MTTFGFEAEFQTNAAGVIAALHDRNLAGDGRLHGYHCDCDNCAFGNGHPFRGQSDSSCSGEIISDVFGAAANDYDIEYDAPAMMCALADAAVDVDAEPGLSSGFHVHVGVGGIGSTELADILWQYVRWEHVLERIAAGRWSERRDGMNTTVRAALAGHFQNYGVSRVDATRLHLHEGLATEAFKGQMLGRHTGSDRHSNLNISQSSHRTWEFRLWNSTRSAWRMEMFCGLSVALMDQGVVENLAILDPPQRMAKPSTGIRSIAEAVNTAGYDRVAELLERQAAYLDDRAHEAPSVLTAL